MTETPSDQFILTKRHIVIPLIIMQIYPLHIVWTAYRQVPKVSEIFADLLGVDTVALPMVTRIMQATYQWWIIIPVITTGLALACFHRKIRTMSLPSAVLLLTLILSHGMRVLLTEGCFAPMIMTITQISQKENRRTKPCTSISEWPRESENALTGKWVITSDEDEITGRYVYHFKADGVIDLIQYISKEDAEPKSTNRMGTFRLQKDEVTIDWQNGKVPSQQYKIQRHDKTIFLVHVKPDKSLELSKEKQCY